MAHSGTTSDLSTYLHMFSLQIRAVALSARITPSSGHGQSIGSGISADIMVPVASCQFPVNLHGEEQKGSPTCPDLRFPFIDLGSDPRHQRLGTKWKLLEQLLKVNKFINGISIYNPWKLSPSIV